MRPVRARFRVEVRALEIADQVELAIFKPAPLEGATRVQERASHVGGEHRHLRGGEGAAETDAVRGVLRRRSDRSRRRDQGHLVAGPCGRHDRARPLDGPLHARLRLLVEPRHALRVVDDHDHRGRRGRHRVPGRDGRPREREHEEEDRERAQDEEQDLAKTQATNLPRLELTEELRRRELDLRKPPPAQEMDDHRDRGERKRREEA